MLKNSHLSVLSGLVLSLGSLVQPVEIHADSVIQEAVRDVELEVRVQALAEESESLINKLDDAQIQWVIPEGSEVKKGDSLIRFLTAEILDDIMDKEQALLQAKLSSNTSQLLIEGTIQEKQDELQALLGDISVLEAQRDKLKSYPLKDEVVLEQSRLNVIEEEYKASQADFEREAARYEAKMVSEKQWRKAKRDLELKKEDVKHQEIQLELAELGATQRSLKVLDLKIDNAYLKKQELEWGIEVQENIVDFKRDNLVKRIEIYQKSLDQVQEEYEHREIFSPNDGLVSYMPRLIRSIQEGSVINKGTGLFNIVDPKKLVFKGTLKSKDVNLFKKGDPAQLMFFDAGKKIQIPAKISKINRSPSDVAGESSQWSDQNKSSGIKVYEVIFEATSETGDLKPGIYGHAKLKTREPFKGPALPLKDLHWKDGQARLAIDGVYKKVHGKAINDMFFLDDPTLLGQAYHQNGVEEGGVQEVLPFGEMAKTNRIQLTAEMEPLSAEVIAVPRFRYWYSLKMDWVTEDGANVKKGDKLFEMGSDSSKKRKEKLEKDIERESAELDTEEKEHQNLLRENKLKRKLAENELEIARLELEIVQNSADVTKIYNTRNQLRQKKIQREFAQWSQEWSKSKGQVIGDVEQRKLARELRQLELEEERLTLQYEEAIKEDELRLSSGNMALIRQRYLFESNMRSIRNREKTSTKKVEDQKRYVEKLKRDYEKLKSEEALLTVTAPRWGTIKFLKIWDGLRMSPVAPGYSIYSGMSLATLYDISDMMLRLPLNENLYKKVGGDLDVKVYVPSVSELPLEAKIDKVDTVFRSKERPDLQSESLYGSQEKLGEQVFYVNIRVITPKGMVIKPGTIATVHLEWKEGA